MVTALGSEDVVIRTRLIQNAEQFPDAPFVILENGETWTARRTLEVACAAANILFAAGVRQDDKVAVMLPNSAEYLRAWWGICMLGAVLVPINTAFKGTLLTNVVTLSRPTAFVIGRDFIERFADLEAVLKTSIVLTPEDLLGATTSLPPLERPLEFWDIHALMLTSGTTGPSKLSATTYLHSCVTGATHMRDFGATADDILLVDLPLFHLGVMYLAVATLRTRTQIALRKRPDFTNYWPIAKDIGANFGLLLSSMVPYLLSQPPRETDRDHNIRSLLIAPLPRDVPAFQARFGVKRVHTAFGSSEIPGALIGAQGDEFVQGYCGRPREGLQIKLVDSHDMEVPVGQPGELVVRPEIPWQLSAGYVGNDAATAQAWRNGWFHSGDTLRRDEAGRFFFVDRAKDMVRRRGENISSSEVEAELATHADVAEVACVAVRVPEWLDDELKAWIVPKPGVEINFELLLQHCVDRLPHFMVPRFFEASVEFSKTASGKIEKFLLKNRGNGADTWDREAHGYQLTRHGLRKVSKASA